MWSKLSSIKPADGHRPQIHDARGLFDVRQAGVVGMEGQRDEGLEAAGLVLQLAQADQVVDPMIGVFQMAVEHRGVRAQAQPMGRAVDVDPAAGVGLVLADLVAHLGMENLGPAAGQAAQAGLDQFFQDRPIERPGLPA